MKITNDPGIYEILPQTQTSQAQLEPGQAFAQYLTQAMDQIAPSQAVSQSADVSQLSDVAAPVISGLCDQMGGLLGLLEEFAQTLGDPQSTPRDLEPLIKNLETRAYELQEDLAAAGDSEELSALAGDLLGQVRTESIKYWRGDYI